MDKEEASELERKIHQLEASNLEGRVKVMLLDFQLVIRHAYPDTVESEPVARKIVAFLREHMVK